MDEYLTEILKMEGISGALLLGPKGEVIARAPDRAWEVKSLDAILQEVEWTFASLRLYGEEVDEIDFSFDGIRLVARKLAGSVLLVFCSPGVDAAMLRLTMNVTVAQIKEQAGMYTFLSRKWVDPDLSHQELSQIYEILKKSEPGEVQHA
jgi:hypothetical protein